jgi:lipoprotein-releasing system ATP-binding protein
MSHSLIEARGLRKTYPSAGSGDLDVLTGVDLTVARGEVVAVVGESGTGKSTLLHVLGTLDRPTGGHVYFQGVDVFRNSDEDLAAFRNRSIGFVFQFHHLLPEFTALENVAMPAMIGGQSLSECEPRATELLALLGIEARKNHRPGQLSGGEQQRVAVARALINNPDLVLADEPTGNLDERTAGRLHEEIIRLSKTTRHSFVIATHNLALARLADRVLRLEDGTLTAIDLAAEGEQEPRL